MMTIKIARSRRAELQQELAYLLRNPKATLEDHEFILTELEKLCQEVRNRIIEKEELLRQ